ncbi:MAG: hypothetical protein ACT4UP_08300 [Gammaproteobacteria bacterium]
MTTAWRKSWLRELNRSASTLAHRVGKGEVDRIGADLRGVFDESFAQALRVEGFEIVAAPGEGVLELAPRIVELVVSAPEGLWPDFGRIAWIAGRGRLVLELRDSPTGAPLARFTEHAETRLEAGLALPRQSDRNMAAFRSLFERWARIAAAEIREYQARSPLPEDLVPHQKLPD